MSDTLLTDLHVKYIQNLGNNKDDLTYHMTAHLRMNAVYWGVTALCIMKHKDALDAKDTIEYVMSCWDDEAGAFGAHPGHDAHILSTLSAIQVLATHDALGRIDAPRVIDCTPSPIIPARSLIIGPHHWQSSCACSSPRASLQATHSARPTRASSTAPCRPSRSSARSTASTAPAPSRTSLRAATLMGALGA